MKLCIACEQSFGTVSWVCPRCGFAQTKRKGIISFISDTKNEQEELVPLEEFAVFEERHFWFKRRSQLIIWFLKKYFPLRYNFLEIGCGSGYVSRIIEKELSIPEQYGTDISLTRLDFCRTRTKSVQLFQADAQGLPFVDEFDVIGIFDVLEHVDDDRQVLIQAHQALKKRSGAGVIITVPQHPSLFSQHDVMSGHVRRYTRNEITGKIRHAGFRIERVTSFVSFVLPVLFISRIFNKKSKAMDIRREFQINRFLNFLFSQVAAIEFLLIRFGINFPFGSSLLIIAKNKSSLKKKVKEKIFLERN